MTYKHSYYYKTLEDVKDYLHPGGVKYFFLDAEPKLKEMYCRGNNKFFVDMYMAVFSTMYLAANRVNEITRMKMDDLSVFKEYGILYFKIKTENEKHPTKKLKIVVVSYSTPHDKVFIKKITKWFSMLYKRHNFEKKTGYTWKQVLCRKFKNQDDKTLVLSLLQKEYLFPTAYNKQKNAGHLSKRTIQEKCTKLLGCNSHFIRKLRASILIDKFGATPRQLQEYLGHSRISSGDPYVAISQTNLKKMIANKEFV